MNESGLPGKLAVVPASNYKTKTCRKCRIHGEVVELEGHKSSCPHKFCECVNCQKLDRQRRKSKRLKTIESTQQQKGNGRMGSDLGKGTTSADPVPYNMPYNTPYPREIPVTPFPLPPFHTLLPKTLPRSPSITPWQKPTMFSSNEEQGFLSQEPVNSVNTQRTSQPLGYPNQMMDLRYPYYQVNTGNTVPQVGNFAHSHTDGQRHSSTINANPVYLPINFWYDGSRVVAPPGFYPQKQESHSAQPNLQTYGDIPQRNNGNYYGDSYDVSSACHEAPPCTVTQDPADKMLYTDMAKYNDL